MPPVKNVGEPCAREPHARFEVAAGGNQASRQAVRPRRLSPTLPPSRIELVDSSLAPPTGEDGWAEPVSLPLVAQGAGRGLRESSKHRLLLTRDAVAQTTAVVAEAQRFGSGCGMRERTMCLESEIPDLRAKVRVGSSSQRENHCG